MIKFANSISVLIMFIKADFLINLNNMMMKKTTVLKAFALLLSCTILFAGCNSLKKMQKNHDKMAKYEQTPNPLEMQGDKIAINVKGEYAPKYFNKKAQVMLQPELRYEGGTLVLKPMLLKGQSVDGEGTLIGYDNGGSFTYTDQIDYKPEMAQATLVLNPTAFLAKKAKNQVPTTNEEAKGVKKSVALGEKEVAKGTNITASRISNEAKPSFASDKYVKESILTKEATIFFIVDQYNLDWNWKYNKIDENKNKIKDLETAFEGNMAIKSVEISAWASPEGEESRNQNLSDNRGKTAEKFVHDAYNKAIDKKAKALKVKPNTLKKEFPVSVQAQGEDWDGFLNSLRASDISEKNTIINVINSQTDHARREQEIRNMTVIYSQIEEKILPPLRRANIHVNFLEPKKTDAQIATLAVSHPDSLTVEELLYAATLTQDQATKLKIYTAATKVYANDWRGFNNVAYISIQQKDYTTASSALDKANGLVPNNPTVLNNLGVVALAKGDYKNAKSYFENAVKAGSAEAKENLGIISIKEGNYAAASSSLANEKCTYNLGLTQLLNKQNDAAKATLSCAPQDAKTLYLLAVCSARTNDSTGVVNYLQQAFTKDPNLKKQAKNDMEFMNFVTSSEFMNLLK